MKDDLSQEIHGNMIFSVYSHRREKHDTVSFHQKILKDDLILQKHSQRRLTFWIDILERVLLVLCNFMEVLQAFSYIPFQQKSRKNLISRIEVWLLLQIIQLEKFYKGEFSNFVPFSSQELYFEIFLRANQGNYFFIKGWYIIPKIYKRR